MAIINKNYLSSARLNPGPANPQTRAATFSNYASQGYLGAASGARLNISSVNAPYAQNNIDKVGPVIDAREVKRFTMSAYDAAMRIADRENTLIANEKVVQFRDQMRDLTSNPETGYLLTKGKLAVQGRQNAQARVEELTKSMMNDVSPAVAAKMAPAIAGERQATMNGIANHSLNNKQVWENDIQKMRSDELSDKMVDVVSDSKVYNDVMMRELYRIWPDNPDNTINEGNAQKREARYEQLAVEAVDYRMFRGAGIKSGEQLFEYLMPNLSAGTQVKITESIQREVTRWNAKQDQGLAAMSRKQILIKKQNLNIALGKYLQTGERLPQTLLGQALLDGDLGSDEVSAYQRLTAEDKVVDDPSTYNQMMDLIYTSAGDEYTPQQIDYIITDTELLNPSTRISLLNRNQTAVDSNSRRARKLGRDKLKGLIRSSLSGPIATNNEGKLLYEWQREMDDRLDQGENVPDIMNDFDSRFSQPMLNTMNLEAPEGLPRPHNLKSAQEMMIELRDLDQKGLVTDRFAAKQRYAIGRFIDVYSRYEDRVRKQAEELNKDNP